MKLKTEPALIVSTLVGIITAIYPSVTISDHTEAVLAAIISVVFSVAGGLVIRGKVTPTSVLDAAKTETEQGVKEAVVYARLHPEQVAEIVTAVQTRQGRATLEQEALAALTSGPHPMTLMPGADSTAPAPQPQGTYIAAEHPMHVAYVPEDLTPVTNGSTPVSA